MHLEQVILAILAAINIFAFLVMMNDKGKSIRGGNTERTPEGLIFFIAAAFGSIGVYTGMLTFRHKTKKWYFQLGIPLLILQNLATLYLIKEILPIN